MKKVLFVGLGTMGYSMAGHLAKFIVEQKKSKLFVYNRTISKAKKWAKQFSIPFLQKEELLIQAKDADLILSCLGRDEDLEEFFLGKNGLFSQLKKKCLVIDHSTISYSLVEKLNKIFKEKQIGFLDAPISGGEIGAQKGELSIMVGGEKKNFTKALPYLKTYGGNIIHIGKSGAGQLTKMVNQICIAGLLQGLSEGINFLEQEKLDFTKVFSAISKGAASSWQMENRALTMKKNQYNFGFQIKWMIKDLEYALAQGRKNQTKLKLTQEVLRRYKALAKKGHEGKDTSALRLFDKEK